MKRLILTLLFMGAVMSQEKFYGFEFVKESGGIKEYTMTSNGLRVLLKQDNTAPVATFMVTYEVGSRNEAIGYTGSTHLLEHLMFKGSRKFNTKKGNSVFQTLQSLGARMNATTWLDRTNYFAVLPSEHLETLIEIEADRMRSAYIKEEDRQSEMTVVRNEFERGQNSPSGVLDENIWATAYQAHPYHHSTIGWKEDIENVSIERLKEFYDTFYWPNNATAIAIGDFTEADALSVIKKHFGKIRKSTKPIPEVYTAEPKQEGIRTITLKRAGQQGIVGVAHKTPSATNPDAAAFMVLSSILSSGKNSRFYKNITDKGLTTSVYIWDSLFRDPGLFTVYANLSPDVDHKTVEEAIVNEYEKIKKDGVSEEEVKRAQSQLIASMKFSQDGSYAVASGLNEAIASGDWTLYTTYGDKIGAVTKEDIKKTVNKYFLEDLSTIGYFVPLGSGGQGQKPATSAKELEKMKQKHFSTEEELLSSKIIDTEPVKGIRLLTLKRGTGVVTMRGSMLGGDIYSTKNNRTADMVTAMLDQGTTNMSKFEISEKLESAGARLNFFNGQARVGFSGKFLSDDTNMVIGLLADQLKNPLFSKDELEKSKKRQIAGYKRSKESTRGNAMNDMLQAFYGSDHQNSPTNPDRAIEQIKKLTSEDLKDYHSKNYGLGSMVLVVVGDVDHMKMENLIKQSFDDWKQSPLKNKEEQKTGNKVANKAYVTMEDKTSTDFVVGTALGIDRYHPDYLPLYLATHTLGGNFSARLMQTVRVKEGLTYGINSALSGFGNSNDGYWMVGGTFSPKLLSKGESSTLREIKKWAEGGITQKELDVTKSTLIGGFQVGFDTTGGLAGGILNAAVVHNDLTYLDSYPNMLKSITLDQVNSAISKYISFDGLYQVAAGTIDKDGKPIEDK
ncbi:MAG: M16 family metallopeptidase [Candidatus Neomarinimicrobiota bacterium]